MKERQENGFPSWAIWLIATNYIIKNRQLQAHNIINKGFITGGQRVL
jgi:hypothetical protein